MKKIFSLISGVALMAFALVSCSPDDFTSPNGVLPNVSDYEDNFEVTVDQETNYAYFTFKSAPGISPVWIIDGKTWNGDFKAKKYYRKAGDYTVECKVKNANGISDGSVTKTFHVDKTKMSGFGGFDAESDKNLFKHATFTQASGHYAPGWSKIADPTASIKELGFSVMLPIATTEQWQAQVPFETNISTVADDETYDFSVIMTSSADHPAGVTVKFTNPNDDNDFYFAERVPLKAGEPYCFYMTKMPSRNIENLKLFFDFGGNAENCEFEIENLCFIKTSDNEIVAPEKGEPEPVWVEGGNLWESANPTLGSLFYKTGEDWHDPEQSLDVKVDGEDIYVNIPVGTVARWQCQVPFETSIGAEAGVEYDFLAVVESNASFKAMFKLVDAGDDNNFFFADEEPLTAGGETRVVKRQVTIPTSCDKLKLFFDFGGCPENTEIHISKIILQKHQE